MGKVLVGKIGSVQPDLCKHPQERLRPRGNARNAWWTCLDCGSRWERKHYEEPAPHGAEKMDAMRKAERDPIRRDSRKLYMQWALS
eukprot:5159335-Amphidinium_carterae.2